MSNHTQSPVPKIFKGIAVFTPGGDLIYGVDPSKQTQWHIHLCKGLQQAFQLPKPPHFLIPGHTATVERWLNPETRSITTIAEAYPAVRRYIPLLRVIFQLEPSTCWQVASWQEEYCNRAIIETYRSQFAPLWTRQNLILRQDPPTLVNQLSNSRNIATPSSRIAYQSDAPSKEHRETYIFRLFISSDHSRTEKTLGNIHQILEKGLTCPYKLKVIDVAKNPEQAIRNCVLTTPTLIRVMPEPVKRVVGKLDDVERVLDIITEKI